MKLNAEERRRLQLSPRIVTALLLFMFGCVFSLVKYVTPTGAAKAGHTSHQWQGEIRRNYPELHESWINPVAQVAINSAGELVVSTQTGTQLGAYRIKGMPDTPDAFFKLIRNQKVLCMDIEGEGKRAESQVAELRMKPDLTTLPVITMSPECSFSLSNRDPQKDSQRVRYAN